jgi:hypothetical protein
MLRACLWHATPGHLMCASVMGPPSDRSGRGGRLRVVVGSFSGALGLGGERVGVGPEARCEQHG